MSVCIDTHVHTHINICTHTPHLTLTHFHLGNFFIDSDSPQSSSLEKPFSTLLRGFTGGSAVKNLLADAGDVGLIPGLGRSPDKGMVTHSSFLACRIPRTEEPGGLQSMGSKS